MVLLRKLSQWFRVERAERPWVLLLSGGTFFLTAANVMLWSLLQTLLIKRAGVQYLPYFYVMSSLAILVGAGITLRFLRRWRPLSQSSFFTFIALGGSLVLTLTQHFFSGGEGLPLLLAFVMFGLFVNSAAIIGASDKLSAIATDVFNAEQLQRLQPFIVSSATASAFITGMLLATLSQRVSSTALFAFVTAALAAAAILFGPLRREAKKSPLPALPAEAEKSPAGGKAKRGMAAYFSDPQLRRFLYLLGAIIGLSMVFTRIFSYQFAVAANARFHSEAELNSFMGLYTALLSLGSLFFVNSVQRTLVARYGLTKNLFIPPTVVLTGVAALIAYPFFPAVIAVVYLREIILNVQQFASYAMLQGISDHQRNQALSWLNGPVMTLGGLLGSALLVGVSYFFGESGPKDIIRMLALFAMLFLLLRLFFTVRLRRAYPSVLWNSLRREDYKTRLRAVEAMAELRFMVDHPLGAVLDIMRNEAEPVALRIATLRTVAAIRDPSGLRAVGKILRHPDGQLRAEAVRTVAAFRYQPDRLYESGFSRHMLIQRLRQAFVDEDVPEIVNEILSALIALRDPDIITLIASSLQSPSPERVHSALHSLRRFHDSAIIDYVTPFLVSANTDLRAQAVAAIWQFPWERGAVLDKILDDMLGAPPDSEEHRKGLYLVGALHSHDRRAALVAALRAGDRKTRLEAAVGLLKLGDESGISEIEGVMRAGTAEEAREVEGLAGHADVPQLQRQRIQALIHEHHLHYPADLPVSEPLRVRLRDIPKECLEALLSYYQAGDAIEDRRKIERALREAEFPRLRGRAALVTLSSPWREMAGTALLAHGFLVRHVASGAEASPGETVVGMAEDKDLPPDAFALSQQAGALEERQAARTHYAPSELLAVIRRFRPGSF